MIDALGLLGVLGVFSWEDVKSRTLNISALALAAIVGLVLHLAGGRVSLWNLLGGIGVGLALYVFSVASGEKIGKGDAILVMVTGIFLGFWNNLLLLWVACLFAAAGGMMGMALFDKGPKDRLPFVPFMLAGYSICLLFWGGRLV